MGASVTQFDEYFTIGLPKQLFHYTDAAGFLGILETQEIWATDASCLNDWQELIYAKELIAEELERLCEYPSWNRTFKITKDEQTLLNKLRETFVSVPRVYDVFVASFSTQMDILSQWREYGCYNIGVSASALQSCAAAQQQSFLGRCVYDQPDQLDFVRSLVKSLITEYRSHCNPQELEKDMLYSLHRYGALLKHESFCEEEEWRIVLSGMQDLEFRQQKNIVIPFVRVDIECALGTRHNSPVVPLITLGPGNDRVAEQTVRRLTEKKLGFEVFVRRSDTPYVRD